MPQKYYGDLTDSEKMSLFIADDVFIFPHRDPDVAIDYCGLSGTLPLSQYLDIVNNSTFTLYFKVEATVLSGNASAWSDLTEELGSVSAGEKSAKEWTPERLVPSSKVTESLRVYIRAYKQSDYTDLYGEDYVDFNYYFFDHNDGIRLHLGDFEEDYDGWSNGGSKISRTTDHPYTGSWGISFFGGDNRTTDSSGQIIPDKSAYTHKFYSGAGYSEVFIIFHLTYTFYTSDTGIQNIPPVLRVWTDETDSIIRINQPRNTYKPMRIAVKIPADNGYVYWASLGQMAGAIADYYSYFDTIMIVAFS